MIREVLVWKFVALQNLEELQTRERQGQRGASVHFRTFVMSNVLRLGEDVQFRATEGWVVEGDAPNEVAVAGVAPMAAVAMAKVPGALPVCRGGSARLRSAHALQSPYGHW